jgi:hypothetical protein
MSVSLSSSKALLQLYKKLLRSAATYPSKNRAGIYQAIREEWRENKTLEPQEKRDKQITVAYKGLEQLRQFDEHVMSSGKGPSSPSWSVTLEQNPMPKPADYDERKKAKDKKR